jgi:hypothetical protein
MSAKSARPQTYVPVSKERWIEMYGGQRLLDREGFVVVPCERCDDPICHGWRVQKSVQRPQPVVGILDRAESI